MDSAVRPVVVVGGGLAGLAAACDLTRRGHRVTLLEARARLGGATFSFDRDGLVVDNGQHVLLRCYTEYRAFLDLVGSGRYIDLQDRFRIPVRGPDGRLAVLSRNGMPAPLHLGPALASYKLLSAVDRLKVLAATTLLRTVNPADPRTDDRSFADWLRAHGQSPAAIDALWNLITVAALNTDAEHASLALCAMVFQTALLQRADAADIGIPTRPLGELHGDAARRYLTAHGARVRTNAAVRSVRKADNGKADNGFDVVLDDEVLPASAVVFAAPPEATAAMLPAGALADPDRLAGLGAAPIVNVHAVYHRKVTDLPFLAIVGSPVQWVFDRTEVAGVRTGQYLAVSVSAAEEWIDAPTNQLREVFLPELARLYPAAARTECTSFFVTRERRATFRQAPGSARLRPPARTALPGCVLAGAWTATGWPDTMEGAVRSGNEAARIVDQTLASAGLARSVAS